MVWFKVDDKLHSHNKIRKVLADDPAALALWVVAGSWSSDNLTDGLIPDHQLPWLLPSGADEQARKLVTAGLWRRVKGGYQFHEWAGDGDGTKRNPTRDEVETERRQKSEAGRKGGLARGKGSSKDQADAKADAKAGATADASGLLDPPTRPDPTKKVKSSSSPAPPATDADFDRFWSHYPRKVGKVPARKAWAQALKQGVPAETIIAGAERYAKERHGEDEKFTAHAATWIHGERWNDTPDPRPPAAAGPVMPWELWS